MEFTGKNAEKVWKKVLKHILENGNELVDNKNMPHKESLNIIAKIESMEGITKPIEILRGFEKWVYPNLEEIKDSILEKNPFNRYYYDYGLRAFNFNGVNQVDDYVVPLLKKSPNSRRAVVVFYTPSDGVPLKKETPGLITMAFNIRNKKLHATSVLRSNDFFYGWPGNIIQTYVLADYIAKKLNCHVGTITTLSISAHIFEEQFKDIEKVLKHK